MKFPHRYLQHNRSKFIIALIALTMHLFTFGTLALAKIDDHNEGGGGGGGPDCQLVPTDPSCGGGSPQPTPCTGIHCQGLPTEIGPEVLTEGSSSSSSAGNGDETWPSDAFASSIPTLPPDASVGFPNEDEARVAIDDAIELFGIDGMIAKQSSGGGSAESAEKIDREELGRSGAAPSVLASVGGLNVGANTKANLAAANAYGTTDSKGLKSNFLSGGHGGDVNDKSKTANDSENSNDKFGVADNSDAAKYESASGALLPGASDRGLAGTGEMGADGPGGAGLVNGGREGDEYFARAGKLSLFEIVNRRYEVWGSQNLR